MTAVETPTRTQYPVHYKTVRLSNQDAFDWNCQEHITPRVTAEQIQEALAPFEARMEGVERENEALRKKSPSKAAALISSDCF